MSIVIPFQMLTQCIILSLHYQETTTCNGKLEILAYKGEFKQIFIPISLSLSLSSFLTIYFQAILVEL